MGEYFEQGLSSASVKVAKMLRTCIKCRWLSISPEIQICSGWADHCHF